MGFWANANTGSRPSFSYCFSCLGWGFSKTNPERNYITWGRQKLKAKTRERKIKHRRTSPAGAVSRLHQSAYCSCLFPPYVEIHYIVLVLLIGKILYNCACSSSKCDFLGFSPKTIIPPNPHSTDRPIERLFHVDCQILSFFRCEDRFPIADVTLFRISCKVVCFNPRERRVVADNIRRHILS